MLPVRKIVLTAVVAASLVALQVRPVHAAFGITSVAGAIELPAPPPPNVLPGSNENAQPIVFPEVLNATVMSPSGLPVDHNGTAVVAAPTISGNVVNPALISTTLPQGTTFSSYLFHFDPVGAIPFPAATYVATITFDNPIIGVQLFSDGFALEKPSGTAYTGTLEQGDAEVAANFGPPVGYYPGGLSYRGLEEDSFVLAISGTTVMLSGNVYGAEIDQIRIITARGVGAVPEPTTIITWGTIVAIGCCRAFARRQS